MRLTQSLFPSDVLRLQCFVDDPIAAIRGSAREPRTIAATIMIIWETLKCKLSHSKGQMGQGVSWIGGELKLQPSVIHAQIKPAIIEDIIDTLHSIQSVNLIPKKTLESLAGKINHVASLLIPLRPFLQLMWAAIHSDPHSTTVWRKQIHHALTWFTVFFKPGSSALGRDFRLPDFLGWGVQVEIGTDASPWGLGMASP